MHINENDIRDFFSSYEQRFNQSLKGKEDPDAAASAFTSCFIESSPLGTQCGHNDSDFKTKISEGFAFYKKIGTQSIHILSLDLSRIDDFHSMAKVHWQYKGINKKQLEAVFHFDVIYLLQHLEGLTKIFAYITGDEQKALKENGMLD